MLLSFTNNFPCVCAVLFMYMYVFVLNVLFSEFSLNENFIIILLIQDFWVLILEKGKIHLGVMVFFINYLCTLFSVREKFSLSF